MENLVGDLVVIFKTRVIGAVFLNKVSGFLSVIVEDEKALLNFFCIVNVEHKICELNRLFK